MLTVLSVIVALGVLIAVHEAGHFAAARLFGVHVEKFSLGFGPRLVGWRRGGTDYRVSLIMLGGYVKMRGDNPEESTGLPGSFNALVWWRRSLIALAGPLANVLLAIFVFIVSFMMGKVYDDQLPVVGAVDTLWASQLQRGDVIAQLNGEPIEGWSRLLRYTHAAAPDTLLLHRDGQTFTVVLDSLTAIDWYTRVQAHADAIVGEVMPGLPAYQSGLQPGDRILAVDDTLVTDWYDMRERVVGSSATHVRLTIERQGVTFQPVIALDSTLAGVNRKLIGITQSMPVRLEERYTLGESMANGLLTAAFTIQQTYTGIYQLLSKPSSLRSNIGSPVMMVPMGTQIARRGFSDVLFFFGAISMLLAIMNLLPIPVLDGGQIFFCLIEGASGKQLPVRVRHILQQIGVAMLLSLMVFAVYNDFSKLISRGLSLREQSQFISQ
ncbi:MAG: RIP metalloprotease RseP [Candidatus Cloacimonetes bacterium]|nr:RIP metalloprotease RseP [Candidatus Cloacimonadota bacterium]